MMFSKWMIAGATLLALTTTAARAGDATADRAAREPRRAAQARVAEVRREAPPADQGSGGDACHRSDCCAMRVSPAAEASRFTDMG